MTQHFVRAVAAAVFVTILAAGPALAEERSGRFEGASGHETKGTVVVEGATLALSGNFTFDGAPDPKLAFGNDNTADVSTIFAPLESDTGAQSYRVPESIDPAQFSHVYLWCEQYAVPLGKARLSN